MMKRLWKMVLCCLLVTGGMREWGMAQQPVVRFSHLGIAQGLPQSSVYCMFQDSKGFIWLGTSQGISRYDGYGFRNFTYDPANPFSIHSNDPLSIHEDAAGNLLIGSEQGLELFDTRTEKFHRINAFDGKTEIPYRHVKALIKDREGRIWAGSTIGLLRYDEKERRLIREIHVKEGKFQLNYIAEDNAGILWLGGYSGLRRYNPETKRMLPIPESISKNPFYDKSVLQSMKLDSAQNLWLGTAKDGLIVWNKASDSCENFHSGSGDKAVSSEMVRAIGFHDGDAWIGTRHGVYVIAGNRSKVRNFMVNRDDPWSLSSNSVLSFMKDNAGSVWIGTFSGGASILHPGNNNFSFISDRTSPLPGLSYRVTSSIVEDRHGRFWIGTEGGGVNYYDRELGVIRHVRIGNGPQHTINPQMVKSIALDDRDVLWIATLDGLYSYHTVSGQMQRHPLKQTPLNSLDEVAYSVITDGDRRWIGTKAGLIRRDADGSLIHYRHRKNDPRSLVFDDINIILRDHAGAIWAGTEAGLACLPAGADRFENYPLPYDSVYNKDAIIALYEDDRHQIWIGTRNGLKLLDKQRRTFHSLDVSFGMPSNIVRAISQDGRGDYWISQDRSITRLVLRKATGPFSKADVEIRNYPMTGGSSANEFLAANCKTSRGELMFGGSGGVVSFSPEALVSNPVPPPVVLTSFLIKNQPVEIGGKNSPLHEAITYSDHITLSHDQAYFTIGFAALNYIKPGSNQYAYTLEGLSGTPEWNFVGRQQQATYTNLDAGEYVFKVKAANNDGLWNDQYTQLRITVLPPIWKTWYAWLFYVVAAGAVLYFCWKYSLKTARLRHELVLQQRSREKDRELAQRKLSFFTHISHEIKTPLTLILAPLDKLVDQEKGNARLLNQLLLMQRNGERLLRLTDQLLDFRKLEAGHMQLQVTEQDAVQLVREVVLSFDAYARQRGVRLTLSSQEPGMAAWLDRDKVEKMLCNLISNALKFTPAGGRIRVSVKREGQELLLMVEDNGAGIPEKHIGKIFDMFQHFSASGQDVGGTGIGLAFTKGLVALHHGSVSVESTPAAESQPGQTCFLIRLPVGPAEYPLRERLAGTVAPEAQPERLVAEAADAGEGDAGAGKPVMLIVEDNEEMLGFIAGHFRDMYTVHEAKDGKEGWRIATNVLPDIVISDVTMPGMSGTDFCRQLKKDERTCHIPVILLTARTPVVFQMEGLETGADDYVTKPFNIGLLQLRVQNLLVSRALLRERYSRDVTLQPLNIAITSADEQFLSKVMRFIDDNIMEPTLNVEQLAREVNLSRITLLRKIKALTNQSTIEFIRSYRLKKAAQLLGTGHNVTEAAYMVGFSDVDYFRKWFKSEFGSTPKEYAASRQQSGPAKGN
ncbi:hybrid sensor histidine kinase/response regulator transcription factor [Chitinophaga sp. NPDC101104]|uniref:hybrid sensor histidine kinase/response regulator transcription factor n=1 Tax=Chitinophaga sp. NPDC101104 TaxID=3390561 RepID=UPI003D064278